MHWDDLRFLVEIGRCGSLAAASRRLHVDQTTVARRLRALERRLGAMLFERVDGCWIATATGARVLERIEGIEESVAGIQRIAASGKGVVGGIVRVTSIASIAIGYLVPRLPSLYARHPALTIELIESNENLSISRREADIAIRLARPHGGDFLIRKLVDCGLALYTSANAMAATTTEDCWVAYREDLAGTPEMRWIEQHRGEGRIRLHSNSPNGLAARDRRRRRARPAAVFSRRCMAGPAPPRRSRAGAEPAAVDAESPRSATTGQCRRGRAMLRGGRREFRR